jgi:hypothetical protein
VFNDAACDLRDLGRRRDCCFNASDRNVERDQKVDPATKKLTALVLSFTAAEDRGSDDLFSSLAHRALNRIDFECRMEGMAADGLQRHRGRWYGYPVRLGPFGVK